MFCAIGAPVLPCTPSPDTLTAMSADPNEPPVAEMAPGADQRQARPLIVGPDAPQAPFPILLEGEVENGFGRGGKELGCPTANLPPAVLSEAEKQHGLTNTGVYYGWSRVVNAPPGASVRPLLLPHSLLTPCRKTSGPRVTTKSGPWS